MAKKTKLNYRMLATLGVITLLLIICLCYIYVGNLEQSPTYYQVKAEQALAQKPKNYSAAISAYNSAARVAKSLDKTDYKFQVAKLFMERAVEEPNLQRMIRQDYYGTGYKLLQGILRDSPNYQLGLELMQERLWSQAINSKNWDTWREYIDISNRVLDIKEDGKLYYRKGYALASQSRRDSSLYADALKSFEKAIELEPDNITYRTGLAVFYETNKQLDKAEDVYKKGIKDIPDKAEIRIKYAVFLRRNDRKGESKAVIQQAIDCDKTDPLGYLTLADISLRDRDFKKAKWASDQAAKIDPDQLEIYLINSRIKRSEGDYQGAADALRQGLKTITERKVGSAKLKYPIGKAKALLNYWLATALLDVYGTTNDAETKKKVLEEIRLCNRELIKFAPGEQGQLKVEGQIAFVDGEYQKAKEKLEEAYKKNADVKTASRLIEVYKRLNLPTRGEILAQKIIAIPGYEKHPYFLIQLAQFRLDARDYKGSREYLDRLLAEEPDNKTAKKLLQAVNVAQGRSSDIGEVSDLTRLILLRRAEDYRIAEKYDLAAGELKKILASHPDDIIVTGRLLGIYMELGEKDKAQEVINKALAACKDNKAKVMELERWKALINEKDAEKRFAIEIEFADKIEEPFQKTLYKYMLCKRYGKQKQALKYLEEANTLKPDNPLVIEYRMLNALQNKEYTQASEIIAPLEKINIEYWYLLRARIAMKEGKYDEAIVNLQEYLAKKSYSQIANLMLGECYLMKGDNERAKEQFAKCLNNDAKDIKAMVGLAKVANQENKIIDHDRWVRRAYSYPEGKRDPYIYEQYVRLDVEPKNIGKAIETREKKFKEQPQNLSNVARLASLYEQQGNIDRAKTLYEYVYANVADKISYSEQLATFYARHNMTTKSDELFTNLISQAKTKENKIRAYIAYGNFLSRFDQAAAQGMYEKAVQIDPKSVRPLKVLANLFSAQAMKLAREGKTKESKIKWKAAIDKLRLVIGLDPSDMQAKQSLYRLYVDADMLTDAVAGYKGLLQSDPNDVKAILGLGLTFLKKGEVDKAISQFKTAIDLFPNMPDAYMLRAEAYQAKGELQLAIEDMRRSVQYSNNVLLRMDLASLYLANDNTELAIATYSGIISGPDTSKYFPAYQKLVELLLAKTRWQSLESICSKGKKEFPKSPMFYLAMADMWKVRSNDRARISELQQAVKIDPMNETVVRTYMEALYDAKQYQGLKQVLEFYQAQPGFAILASTYNSMLLAAQGQTQQAQKDFLLTLANARNSQQISMVIGSMIRTLGKEYCLKNAPQIVKAKPDNWIVLMSLGNLAIDVENYKQAHGYLMDALKVVSGAQARIRILVSLAKMYEKTRNTRGIEKAYTEILRIDPYNFLALNNLAYLYVNDFKEPKQALPLIERALNVKPGNQNLIDTYAWTLALNGQYSRAESFLNDILRRGAKGPDALYHMGYVKEKLGKYKFAKDYYRRAWEYAKDSDTPLKKDIQKGIERVNDELAKENQENK